MHWPLPIRYSWPTPSCDTACTHARTAEPRLGQHSCTGVPVPAAMWQSMRKHGDQAYEKTGEMMDCVLDWMKRMGVPLTRENYLDVAYLGNPPEELSAEEESELPEEFQVWDTDECDE